MFLQGTEVFSLAPIAVVIPFCRVDFEAIATAF